MSEHTPGPWKADEPRFGYQMIRQDPIDWDGHGYQAICTVPQSTKGSHYGEMFRANARLIAAAPDLLAALTHCLGILCESGNLNNYRNLSDEELGKAWVAAAKEAAAAITKATGVPHPSAVVKLQTEPK